jgi:hypothetical protein
VLHQLLGDRQIDQCGIDVFVTEICRQIWKARLGIDPLSIPGEHPVTDKGVTKVVNAGPNPPFFSLYASAPKNPSQHLSSNDG